MRCKNCGWNNPDNLTTCEKCGSVLVSSAPAPQPQNPLQSTVSEHQYFATGSPDVANAGNQCPKCGYPVGGNMRECPQCGASLGVAPSPATPKAGPIHVPTSNPFGTVMGGPAGQVSPAGGNATGFCTLRPIAWKGEEDYRPVTYTGDKIILNRANTDANNNTITSKEQAVITCEDGQWYIENHSEQKTTYIRVVNGKTPIKEGDIIILGNREFEFKG